MKIAQIAPLMESVPPRLYGGTERVVSYLTEELVRQGHDVTLFASGDSKTSARLFPFCEVALRLDRRVKDPLPDHMVMLDAVREMADEFDVLHFHVDVLHYPLIRDFVDRTVTTLHGRLDMPEVRRLYSVFSGAPVVSISHRPAQADAAGELGGHGLPRSAARASSVQPGRQRRLSRLPRPHLARETARSGDRDRRASGRAAEDRGQGGSRRPGLLGGAHPADGRKPSQRRVRRRDRRTREGPLPRRARRRCCSRSTGPSRSESS